MAAQVPRPGAPRPSNNNLAPPTNHIPNTQRVSDSLADNVHNLNINRLPSMPDSAPRPSPLGQPPPFPSSAPHPGVPVASLPFSRPGHPPARPAAPPSGLPQTTLHPTGASMRPTGPPIGQPSPFLSRPPPGSLPSSIGSYTSPASVPPPSGAIPPPGLPRVPPPQQLVGARHSPAASPLASTQVAPPTSAAGGLMSNGPPAFSPGGPRFPPTATAVQPPFGPPPTAASALAPPQAPSIHNPLSSPSLGVPPGPSAQQSSLYPAASHGVTPPPGSPYGSPAWSMQPGQVSAILVTYVARVLHVSRCAGNLVLC